MAAKETPEEYLARLRSVSANFRGLSGDRIKTTRLDDGHYKKEIRDELGNSVYQHHESQDVQIRPKTLKVHAGMLQE
jgi:hypothetical protein